MVGPGLIASVQFETPGCLALLAVVPLVVVLSRRSLAGLGIVRAVLAVIARVLVIACLVLSLAGLQGVRLSDRLSVLFLVDRSRSIPGASTDEAFEFIQSAAAALRPEKDQLGVVAFDGRAAVEQLPMPALAIQYVSSPGAPDQTNLAAALRMGAALFSGDVMRRVVLVSDGNENVDDALVEAEQFAAMGVPVDVLPIRYEHRDEVVFERLSAPPMANTGEPIKLQIVLRATQPSSGRVLLYEGDELIDLDRRGAGAGFPVKLSAGYNRLELTVPANVAKVYRFRAVYEPDDGAQDSIAANNEGQAFTVVSGQGRVLILTQGDTDETQDDLESARILAHALESERIVADVVIAGAQPLDAVTLLNYSLVVLSNVPAYQVGEQEREALAAYVRELGGGLVMIGGDESFGAGGWMDTPVEEVMPVSFDVKSKKQIPKGALVLVMHASEVPQGNSIGERAAIAAVKTLSSRDLIGVLSWEFTGNDLSNWVVPLQAVGDKGAIIQQIRRMSMGDLPDFDPLVRSGATALANRPDAATKHMIVVSDFDPQAPRPDTMQALKDAGVTVSTVAIGFGGHFVDTAKANWIAAQTGGKFHTTQDYSKVPQIFIKETRMVRRSLINENPFTPGRAPAISSVLENVGQEGFPPLGGYVLTTIKPLAQMPLARASVEGDIDPVLAHWQAGLGKSVAFTSGMWTRWGADWAGWSGFSKLWSQIVRWASRPAASTQFDVAATVQGGRGRIQLDAVGTELAETSFTHLTGAILGPDQKPIPLMLSQTGPGRFSGEFDARLPGSYVFSLNYDYTQGAESKRGSVQTGVSVAYSPEYAQLAASESKLSEIAQRTRGRVLAAGDAASVFDRIGLAPAETRRPLWEELLRLTLLLFLLDVAIRRIAIHPLELLRKGRRYVAEISGGRGAGEASAAVLTTLRTTRERARDERAQQPAAEAGPTPARSARYDAPTSPTAAGKKLEEVLGGAGEQESPVVAKPPRKPAPTSEGDMTARLLRAKRAARDKLEEPDRKPPAS